MTRLLRRLLGRDDPPTYVAQMRSLWHLPPDWTLPQTARRVPNQKPKSLAEWLQQHGRKAG